MKSPLHILHLEDDPNDAIFVKNTLTAAGIDCAITCEQNRNDFLEVLDRGGIDLIISDYMLPEFNGMAALEYAHSRWPDIPFIFVSGTLGEERAIDSLKSGATDYVLKDRLGRLVPAVLRAMNEVDERAEKRLAEEALMETGQRLQIIFNESPLGILLVGMDGRPILTNSTLKKMLGYSSEEISRMHFLDFTHPEDAAKSRELFQRFTQGSHREYQMEKRYVRKDGQVLWARVSVCMASGASGHGGLAIGMVEDITEKRNLEAKFIEAQKMEVIGHLAGGVAHDFNNILAVIMGYSDLMIQKLPAENEFRNYVETVRSAAERAAGLTRQLLIFSRKQQVQPVVLDVNDVLTDMNKMLRRLIDEHIELTVMPGKDLGCIKADSGYVGQVLMNLVVNARDAMPNGGKISIATTNVTVDENYARSHPGAIKGDYVMLAVNDTGTGMTDEVKAHIFEAFFTTKPKGKGTGLGLATCHTIVQQAGGFIQVQSALGQGTTFQVYFPRIDQPLDVAARPQTGPTPHGNETLLVVEDDPSLRHLAKSVLESHGYQIISATNGQDALHVVRDHKGSPIRLVVTDVVMPLMGGKVLAEWLKTTNPDIKILFTSGYTDDFSSIEGGAQTGVEFLSKPYVPDALCRKVRGMLDGPK
jgi:PAS domain S-box-containing protein